MKMLFQIPACPWKFSLVLAGLLLISASQSVDAQQLTTTPGTGQLALPTAKSQISSDDVVPLHVTDYLMRRPEARQALADLARTGPNPDIAAAKSGGAATMTTKEFNVLNLRTDSNERIEFTLGVEESRFNLWVETSQLASNGGVITETDLEQMRKALADSTSDDSYMPDSGIIAIDETVFGPPPNVDGDSRTDILIYDIRDFYDPDNGQFSAVLGFFNPADLSGFNSADIIHIDAMPGIYTIDGDLKGYSGVQQTLAHEYQHLIFATTNAGRGPAFVDEGLAEWAEVVTGFTARSITYLSSDSERSRRFLDFRGDGGDIETFGGPNGEDYQRAGLFTNYISERIGTLETGAMARSSSSADVGYYNTVLQPDFALQDVLVNFHVANYVNDPAVAPEYGYMERQYTSVRVSNHTTVDGRAQTSSSVSNGELEAGAADYVSINHVADFQFDGDAVSRSATDRSRLRFVIVATSSSGSTTVTEYEPSADGEGVFLTAEYQTVTIISIHDDLSTTADVNYRYTATWSPAQGGAQFEEFVFEDGLVTNNDAGNTEGFPFWGSAEGYLRVQDRASNHFVIPSGAVLSSVDVAVLYRSIFQSQSPASNARDFNIKIWSADTNGAPDAQILSLDVTDNSASFGADQSEYMFETVDLSGYESQLGALSGALHVSVENAGQDDNYIFVPHAGLTTTNSPSYLYTRFDSERWAPFESIRNGNGDYFLMDLANTIRATFKLNVNTDVETDSQLPHQISLQQNYPNPFNPSTTIRFSLPQTQNVQLNVFDMLGRRVATLVDGALPAGQHQATFDASNLSSGLYLYRLDAGTQQLTRTMMLVK